MCPWYDGSKVGGCCGVPYLLYGVLPSSAIRLLCLVSIWGMHSGVSAYVCEIFFTHLAHMPSTSQSSISSLSRVCSVVCVLLTFIRKQCFKL
jgi:hypothetical protein